ncbi:BREX-1 system adenine-specific DNA-methyltransferase PglX [Providencia rettgeri]|nr:BREX-1 system adenine-specific DNA-methyltransferase PglX [Providencia rettgeri]
MNTAKLKKYAPQARRKFITAVSKQLNQLGIYSDKQISEVKQEGSILLIEGKTFEHSVKTARERLVKKVQAMGYNQLIEQVAYTWFNRLCAIRYMEIHDYLGHGFCVLSHPDNPKGFEIIDHAQDAADELGLDRARIVELKLAGNKDEELYRELLLGQCHKLHEAMPFLFDALDDETELLLPDNLTRTDSILRGLVDGIPEEDWQQVEVIGWLYQFYISEKKDQVIGKVVKSEDIPAATQLFTPNWIVKYLVQNSVGRQWLQTYPDSAIKSQMEYYIEPAEQSDEVNQQLKAITPESIEPETIKVLDPACGSGHILIEAYNVLKAIYEERGFRSRDIPKTILENNLYGLDIDDRAAQLSGFALMMMARDDDKRIFTRNVRLNVLSLQESNHIDLPTLWKALNLSGSWQSGTSQGLFADEEQDLSSLNADNRYQLLKRTLARFTQAKTFGSLIDVPAEEHEQLKELLSILVELQESGDSMQKPAAKQLIEIVHQALVLSFRYDAVIANPPYMGSKYQTAEVKTFLKDNFKGYEKDLFSAYIVRNLQLAKEHGQLGFMTPFVWMFISSYEQLRSTLIDDEIISTLIQLEYSGFDGATVPICTFTLTKGHIPEYISSYIRLSDFKGAANQAPKTLEAIENPECGWFYKSKPDDYKKIPGSPIAYWLQQKTINVFSSTENIKRYVPAAVGLQTGSNDKFVRRWYEVSLDKIGFGLTDCESSERSGFKWFPYNKGGEFKKWYGNRDFVVNWSFNGKEIKSFFDDKGKLRSRPQNTQCYFKPSISWSDITSGGISFRHFEEGFVYDVTGMSAQTPEENMLKTTLAYLNTKIVSWMVKSLNPTLHFQIGNYHALPLPVQELSQLDMASIEKAISLTKRDYNLLETSYGFERDKILQCRGDIKRAVEEIEALGKSFVDDLTFIEESNNKLFISLFGLQEELSPEVDPREVTLHLNPDYRFSKDTSEVRVLKLKSSFLTEFISYSIGNMMGRFSLDSDGLVYAYSGNKGFDQIVAEGAYKTFPADEDGIIPLTDEEWFKDDATNRFREFVQVVWGEEHLQENLDFVAESLCLNAIKSKKSESALETIRRYLSTQFYKDHLKTYSNRPIYWLFSSGKQKAFECLVYLHRYNEGTLSRMRTEYVIPLLGKYDAYAEQLEKQIETADSTSEANRFKKEFDALIKKQVELREFDDKLKHYADMRISLDLDDGVKVNYGKFGDLLADVKAITGSAPEDN